MQNILWVEKYRPRTIKDTILPKALKDTFQRFVDKKEFPNLLLSGRPGVGKTTVARAMLEEIGCDYIIINGSLKGNIDTLRNDIMQYASSMSLTKSGRKYVILDEADYLNANSTQPALRNFMEEYSKNCGFILTCNFKSKIIEPLWSRMSVIDFTIPNKEKPLIASQFNKRLCTILDQEKVTYDNTVIAYVIKKHFPDWRRILNEVQKYSIATNGKIDNGILVNFTETSIKRLVTLVKEKDFTSVRKWLADNSDMDSVELYSTLYEQASTLVNPQSIPALVMILAKYQYQDAFALDKQINTCACLVELMAEISWKD